MLDDRICMLILSGICLIFKMFKTFLNLTIKLVTIHFISFYLKACLYIFKQSFRNMKIWTLQTVMGGGSGMMSGLLMCWMLTQLKLLYKENTITFL